MAKPASARPGPIHDAPVGAPSASLQDTRGQPDDGPVLITAPRFRSPPRPPPYPTSAREQGEEGEVLVRANLDREGTPLDVFVLRSSGHDILDRAALAAVRHWAFEPGRRGGIAVLAWVQIPVRFKLR